MVTLRALECLVAVADEGSMTKAAAALHMSQPALSHQIAAIERELGTPVAVRTKHGVTFTAAGRATADEARTALKAVEQVVEVGQRARRGTSGRLRITCAETTTWMVVPVLRRWRKHWPEVQFDLQESTRSDRMLECLMTDRADLVVGPEPRSTTAHMEAIGTQEMVVVAPSDHPFAARESIAVAELAAEPFLHYQAANSDAPWVDELAAAHRTQLNITLRAFSSRTATQLAGAGLGVSVVPAWPSARCRSIVTRSLQPRVHRSIVAITLTPSDALIRRFTTDLKRVGFARAERPTPSETSQDGNASPHEAPLGVIRPRPAYSPDRSNRQNDRAGV
jgi:DNA-binding transcriptional LysR family regulator